jgi:hypothetical protein
MGDKDICKFYNNKKYIVSCDIKHGKYCNSNYFKCRKYKDKIWFLRCAKIIGKKFRYVFKELAE